MNRNEIKYKSWSAFLVETVMYAVPIIFVGLCINLLYPKDSKPSLKIEAPPMFVPHLRLITEDRILLSDPVLAGAATMSLLADPEPLRLYPSDYGADPKPFPQTQINDQ